MLRFRASRIGAELLMLSLAIGCLAGAVGLITMGYRASRAKPKAVVAVAPTPAPAPDPAPAPEIPPAPAEDLTPAKLAEIAVREAIEADLAKAHDLRAAELEKAIAAARANANRFRQRENLVRAGAAKADLLARRAEDAIDALSRERDILAEKRDEEKASLSYAQLNARDGVAVLPYKGQNGSWRRPIPIDCRGDTAKLQPGGPSFSFDEMSGVLNRRTHPLVVAVARAMIRTKDLATPDGAAVVPYIMFLVRPDGIRPFYAARGLLEPLGIAFGYELVDADADIEFPDLNDPSAWAESPKGRGNASWPPPLAETETPGTGGGNREGYARGGSGPEGSDAGDGGPIGNIMGSSRGRTIPPGPRGLGSLSEGSADDGWPSRTEGGAAAFGNRLDRRAVEALARLGDSDQGGAKSGESGAIFEPPADYDPRNPRGTHGEGSTGTRGRRDPQSSLSGNPESRPGTMGNRSAPRPGSLIPQSLSEAIARNEGLTAPSLDPPSRSIPNGRAERASGGESESQGSPRSAPGGTALNAQGQNAQPAAGASRPQGSPSASPGGSASGTSSQSPSGGGEEKSQGAAGASWDDSNGIVSKTFDMTVACGPNGVTIHPSGETIDLAAMTADDGKLPVTLARIVRDATNKTPGVGLRPKIRFIVKPGGEATYLKAHWQAGKLGAGWPTTLQLANRSTPRLRLEGGRP